MSAQLKIVGNGTSGKFEPTSGNNASFSLTYDGDGNLIQIDKTVGLMTYRKTLTWTAGNLVFISSWIKL